jgi:DNA-directed RNA polymerase specialized sigma24 family protein
MLQGRKFRPDVERLYPQIRTLSAYAARGFKRHTVDAEDVAQDCACRLLQGVSESARRALEGPEPGPWLWVFVLHRALQRLAAARIAARSPPSGHEEPYALESATAPEQPAHEDFRQLLGEVVDALPLELAAVARLPAFGQSIDDVALLECLPAPVVRGRARRAAAVVRAAEAAPQAAVLTEFVGPRTLTEFLVQRRGEGWSVAELGSASGLSTPAVRQGLRRARNSG